MRKITKIRKSVKAISPIIATLLLIAIAVVAALVVYAWVMGYIGVNTSKSGQALQIQSYTSGVDNKHVVIYVQNVGQGTTQLPASGSVYIDNQMAPIASSVSIGPGQTATIIADLTGTTLTWTVGQQITVKVVASGGTFAQTTGYGTAGSGGTGGSSGPTITLGTSSGSTGASVGLTGSGFTASSTLTVKFNNAAVTTSPTTITSTSTGAIPSGATFTVPTIGAGLYTVTVTDGSNPASASFTVGSAGTVAITITSSTVGAGFITVDGTPQTTPYVVNWVPAATHTIAALSPVAGPTGTQYLYTSWSDGASQTHTYTVPTSVATVTANFQTQYQVTFAATPSGAGTTTPSVSTWYNAGVAGQSISASAGSGYTFSAWSTNPSDLISFANSGSASTTMTVNGAATVTATFTQTQTLALDHSTSGTSSQNTITLTLPTSNANDVLYLSVVENSGETVQSVTSSGLTWTNRATATNSNNVREETWYAIRSTSGSTTITITLSSSTYSASAIAFGISGANTASPFEGTPLTSTGTGTTASKSITTTNSNDLIIGAVGVDSNPSLTVNGASFNLIATQANGNYRETSTEYRTVSTTGSYTPSYSLGSSHAWAIIVDAIKQAP